MHNEYFRTVNAVRCDCGRLIKKVRHGKETGTIDQVWSWGEYVNARWHTVIWFCELCWEHRAKRRLLAHSDTCGCDFRLNGYGGEKLPEWLTIDETNTVSPSEGMCQK
jgi:hypothetical protein